PCSWYHPGFAHTSRRAPPWLPGCSVGNRFLQPGPLAEANRCVLLASDQAGAFEARLGGHLGAGARDHISATWFAVPGWATPTHPRRRRLLICGVCCLTCVF